MKRSRPSPQVLLQTGDGRFHDLLHTQNGSTNQYPPESDDRFCLMVRSCTRFTVTSKSPQFVCAFLSQIHCRPVFYWRRFCVTRDGSPHVHQLHHRQFLQGRSFSLPYGQWREKTASSEASPSSGHHSSSAHEAHIRASLNGTPKNAKVFTACQIRARLLQAKNTLTIASWQPCSCNAF